MTTPDKSAELKKHLNEGMDRLRTLRDEIRVEVHLAGMEAKDKWNTLEPHFDKVEKLAHEATESSKEALNGALAKFKEFRGTLSAKVAKATK